MANKTGRFLAVALCRSSGGQFGHKCAKDNGAPEETRAQSQRYLESLDRAFEPTQTRQQRTELKMRLGKFVTQTDRQQRVIDSLLDQISAAAMRHSIRNALPASQDRVSSARLNVLLGLRPIGR